jgi:hypothetical protein
LTPTSRTDHLRTKGHRADSSTDLFSWPKPLADTINNAWTAAKVLWNNSDWSSEFENENRDLHPVFESILDCILSTLEVEGKIFIRPMLKTPSPSPDIAIGAPGLVRMNWNSISVIGELKLPGGISIAASDAWDYLKRALKARPVSRSNLIPFAFGCDFHSLFIIVAKYSARLELCDLVSPWIAELELFPDGWTSKSVPTAGFSTLCHAMNLVDLVGRTVTVNGRITNVDEILYEDESTGVYAISVDSNVYVVKVAIGGNLANLFIAYEKNDYYELYAITQMQPYMVPPASHLSIKDGFAMNNAPSFLRLESEIKWQESFVSSIFVDILMALKQLHSFELSHGDIRPNNIVVYEGKGRLIDWNTLGKINSRSVVPQGQRDCFWPPNSSLYWDPQRAQGRGREWDLASLGIAFYFFSKKGIMKDFIQDASLILSFNGLEHLGLIARVSVKLVQEINSLVQQKLDFDDTLYDRFKHLLQPQSL